MEREITYPVAIVIERRDSRNPWTDHVWQVVDILPESPKHKGWQELPSATSSVEEAESKAGLNVRRFCYGPASVTLHRRLGEAYDHNILTQQPAIWVMLDDTDDSPVPFKLRGVTVDPYEAQGFLDAAEGLAERLPMPAPILAWMAAYMQQMPEPEQFKKRKRINFKREDDQKFGKDPIFTEQGKKLP